MSVQIKPKTNIEEFDFNAVSDITAVISGVYADIYDNSSTYINDNLKYNIYRLLDYSSETVHRNLSSDVDRYIPLISTSYETIDYDNLDADKVPNLELTEFEDSNDKKIHNLDYVNNMICPDLMKSVYSEILAGTTITSNDCISAESQLINRLDQLRYLNTYINDTYNRLVYLNTNLYDGYATGIATDYTDAEAVADGNIDAENIAKIYLINQEAEPKLELDIRGIKVPYKVTKLSNNWYIAKFPQYLLANNSDDLLAIEYLALSNISNGAEMRHSKDALTSSKSYGSTLATTNILKV